MNGRFAREREVTGQTNRGQRTETRQQPFEAKIDKATQRPVKGQREQSISRSSKDSSTKTVHEADRFTRGGRWETSNGVAVKGRGVTELNKHEPELIACAKAKETQGTTH